MCFPCCINLSAFVCFSDMKVGDIVSVFSDVEGKCTRGAKEFKGKKVFLGNGISEVDRSELFCSDGPTK